jgi:hypothetical protein
MVSLPSMEILAIVDCGELMHIFPFDSSDDKSTAGEKAIVKEFPKLKRVHLHHHPKLQQVCEVRMSAPLETIKVRDCWDLRRLPATANCRPRPVVDCDKDWWEKLEWEGWEAGHHGSLFNPHHWQYYKEGSAQRLGSPMMYSGMHGTHSFLSFLCYLWYVSENLKTMDISVNTKIW